MSKNESDLVKDFKKYIHQTYPRKCDWFNVFSCGYGKAGQADVQVGLNSITYYVELKDENTFEAAFKEVRGTQFTRMEQMSRARLPCMVLYKTGCALYLLKGSLTDEDNWLNYYSEDFTGFAKCKKYFLENLFHVEN